MTAGAQQATNTDPLYDPIWAIFIYTAWATLAWSAGDTVGLVVLPVCTGALAVVAVRAQRQSASRTFAAEFSTILLFCAAAIAAGVLALRALTSPPELLASGALFGASGAILFELWRHEKA